jgi:ABC-type molybdate transport system permease subunit
VTDLFKMAEFFFKYILGQRQSFGARSQEISVEIINQIRRIIILLVVTIGALTMFCMGASHLIERILNNLDAGTFIFTPSVWVIIAFLIICFSVLVYSTNKNVWLKMLKKEKEEIKEPQGNGFAGGQLESVISLLVIDIIKERESNRELKKGAINPLV